MRGSQTEPGVISLAVHDLFDIIYQKGIFVAGLREEIVASPQQVLEMMEFGESHRHIGETNMNFYSSRSHTIFRMIIECRQKTQDEGVGNACDAVRVSVLVADFKRLLGVKPTPKTEFLGVPIVSHDISLKLPKEFDARTAWSQCSSIGRVLGFDC